MEQITLDEFKNDTSVLNIYTKITKDDLRKRYLKLSKIHHPDFGGDEDKFKNLTKSYKILMSYIENFRFELNEEEFKKQFPLSNFDSRFWF